MNRCTICREWKDNGEFGRDTRKSNGLKSDCKECERLKTARWRKKNPEKMKVAKRRWYQENREYANAKMRERLESIGPHGLKMKRVYRLRPSMA